MKLYLKIPSGEAKIVEIEPDETVLQLKIKIKEIFNIDPRNQKLIYHGKILDNDQNKLNTYQVQHETTINVVTVIGKTRVYVKCEEKGIEELFELGFSDTLEMIIDHMTKRHEIRQENQMYFYRGSKVEKGVPLLNKLNISNDEIIILSCSPNLSVRTEVLGEIKPQLQSALANFHKSNEYFVSKINKEKNSKSLEELKSIYDLSKNKHDDCIKKIENKKKEITIEVNPDTKKSLELELNSFKIKEAGLLRTESQHLYELQKQKIIADCLEIINKINELERIMKNSSNFAEIQNISKTFQKLELDFGNARSTYEALDFQKKDDQLMAGFEVKLTFEENKKEILSKSKEYHLNILKDGSIPNAKKKQNLYELSKLVTPTSLEIAASREKISKLSTEEEHQDMVLRALNSSLQTSGVEMILSDNHDQDKETLSLFSLVSGAIFETCYQATFLEDDITFEEIQSDSRMKEAFYSEFVGKVSRTIRVSPDNVIVHGIEKGSIKVLFTVVDPNGQEIVFNESQLQSIQQQFSNQVTLQIHHLFKYFLLSPNSFDKRGNFDFRNHRVESHTRGGFQYTQPLGWKRYGLAVSKKYDGGNDDWLAMNGNPNEWAVGFHGLRNTSQSIGPIIQNSLITSGAGQAYKDAIDSRTGQPCGRGAYLSPKVTVCESGYAQSTVVNGKNYKVVFQCRLNPKKIRIPRSQPDYWILNNSEDIRPYGILLKKI